jgi:hypothetical protein
VLYKPITGKLSPDDTLTKEGTTFLPFPFQKPVSGFLFRNFKGFPKYYKFISCLFNSDYSDSMSETQNTWNKGSSMESYYEENSKDTEVQIQTRKDNSYDISPNGKYLPFSLYQIPTKFLCPKISKPTMLHPNFCVLPVLFLYSTWWWLCSYWLNFIK